MRMLSEAEHESLLAAAAEAERLKLLVNTPEILMDKGESYGIRPALGYKHHADCARRAELNEQAQFIEAQNAEIEFLYAALQRVRTRASGARSNNAVASDVRAIADAALKYEA